MARSKVEKSKETTSSLLSLPVFSSSLKGRKKSRNGCFMCKRRKKKCDEKKPVCSTCRRLNIQCSYKLRLSWQAVNQRFVEQESHFVNPESTTANGYHFIIFSIWDVLVSYKLRQPASSGTLYILEPFSLEKYENDTKTEEEWRYEVSKINSSVIPRSELERIQNDLTYGPRTSEQFLFNLYTKVLSRTKSFARSEFIPNDFIHIVIPGCQKFPALYRSVLALSALDLIKGELCKKNSPHDEYLITIYNSLFIGYKNDALNYLHDILDGFDIEVVEMLEELVITILILCNIEITNKGNKEWVRYLTEASLIFGALTTEKILDSDIFKFAYKYFSLRYILLLTTLDHITPKRFLDTTPWPLIESLFVDNTIEPMFGCSPYLLHVIYKLTIFSYLYEGKKMQMHEFVAKLTKMWYILNTITQDEIDGCHELTISASCYFYATKIYLYTILIRHKLEHFLDDGYQAYVPKLWDQLTELSLSQNSLFFPNWCFLIITTSDLLENEEAKRIKALRLFTSLEINWPLSSVVQIRKAIESIWKVYDLVYVGGSGGSGGKSPLDRDKPDPFDCRRVLKEYEYMLALT